MTISVVIPALEEAAQIVGAIQSALADSGPGAGGESEIEIIVVDGGSQDETVRLARDLGARVFVVEAGRRGRAHQLRLGGEKSTGEVVLFLHADTVLPAGWIGAVEGALADARCAGGAFGFRFAEPGWRARWIEFWVSVRVALLGLPYGDQALFMRRRVLEEMGGVPEVPIMEDLDLVRAIKRAGRLEQLALPVRTSARRYRQRGTLRTIFWHQMALLGWYFGWDRARLAQRMGR